MVVGFRGGTLVLTGSGHVPIEQVEVGEQVLTHRGRWARVTETRRASSAVIALKGQGSWGIECAPAQEFLTAERWRDVDPVDGTAIVGVGDARWCSAEGMGGHRWLNAGAAEPYPIRHLMTRQGRYPPDEELFYLAGRYLGDGWVTLDDRGRRSRVCICTSKSSADFLSERLDETSFKFNLSVRDNTATFNCSSHELGEWLSSCFGCGAANKHLPSWAFGMDESWREALFLGYADSDGTPIEGGVRTSSISRALTVSMKMLAAGLGQSSSVTRIVYEGEKRIAGRLVAPQPYYSQSYYRSARSAVVTHDGFWGRVRQALGASGPVPVYCLAVDEDGSFTADGIAVRAYGRGETHGI